MNGSKSLCPQCRKEVSFVKQGRLARCPACGFQYELSEPPYLEPFAGNPNPAGNPFLQFLKMAGIVVLVVLGAGALLLGVLYVGCALAFRR